MTEKKKDRQGVHPDSSNPDLPKYSPESKEYNYVLQLTNVDLDTLEKYREQLVHEARGFA